MPSIFGLGGVTDIFELFFIDKQHQEENGMTPHIYEGLGEAIADSLGTPTDYWIVFNDRLMCILMNNMYGIALPSNGWKTTKLHSKVLQLCP